jgi:CDP-diacylglycerol--glycerol-3-phosphate 3-phosphatidyltransferase
MTLPTKLTCLRLVLTFVIMALLFVPGPAAKAWALGLFLLAAATDWLDGELARRWGQISPLGALLDPIADKVLVLGLFLAFVQLRVIPAWMVLIILLRELVITGVRLVAASRHVVLSAAREGKHKTVSQMVTVFLILILLTVRALPGSESFPAPLHLALEWGVLGCLWLTMALTVYSGALFFWRHRAVLMDTVSR